MNFTKYIFLVVSIPSLFISAPAPVWSDESYAAKKAELEKRLGRLKTVYDAVDWPARTPEEIARRLGGDPRAIEAYLRRALRFEPYRGILRGPQGTLQAGAGNSADLCLLMRQMVGAGEPKPRARFRVAALPGEKARALLQAARSAPLSRPALLPGSAGQPRPAEEKPAAGKEQEVFAKGAEETRRLLAEVKEDLAQIEKLLGGSAAVPAREEEILLAAGEHVWLELERGGKWEAYDPAAAWPVPAEAEILDELPASWRHALGFKVELERLDKEGLHRQALFEKEWPVEDLQGRALDLALAPEGLSLDRLLKQNSKGNPILEQARSFKWFGVLAGLTGDPLVPGRRFDLEGNLGSAPAPGLLDGGAVDPFGRARRLKEGEGKTELAGVWLSFTLKGPGRAPETVERALLDRIGPAARAASKPSIAPAWRKAEKVKLALLRRCQAIAPAGPLGWQGLALESLDRLVHQPLLERALALDQGVYGGKMEEALGGLPELPASLIALHNHAFSLAGASAAGQGICFLPAPNLYLRSESLEVDGDGLVRLRAGIDIALCHLEALGDPAACARARRLHGLLASELEGLVEGADPALWAAQILRSARRLEMEMVRVDKPEELSKVEASPDAKAVMASHLAGGAALLVPARPVEIAGAPRIAWWRLEPSGDVLAVGENGQGQAASEGLFVLKEISIPMVKRCMKFVACLNKAVAGGGSLNQAGAECLGGAIRDIVKDSLDKAIDHFIKDPLNEKLDEARAGMLGEDYEALYQKAKEAYERYQSAQEFAEDPAGNLPGVGEGVQAGRDAANSGREIGSIFGAKIYLLLVMGREIAEYGAQ